MATKYFCDDCQKELSREEEQYEIYGTGRKTFLKRMIFCAFCFQKHWQGEFPKEKE